MNLNFFQTTLAFCGLDLTILILILLIIYFGEKNNNGISNVAGILGGWIIFLLNGIIVLLSLFNLTIFGYSLKLAFLSSIISFFISAIGLLIFSVLIDELFLKTYFKTKTLINTQSNNPTNNEVK